MTLRARHALLLTVPLLVAACRGATATPTPQATPRAAASPSASRPTTAPSPAALGSPAASAITDGSVGVGASTAPVASGFHVDPVLERHLPVLVEGQAVSVETIPVSSYLQLMDPASADAHALRRFLSEVGSDPTAVTMALGTWGPESDPGSFQAFRAPGSRPDHLLAATVYLMRSLSSDPAAATVANTPLGNRTVATVTTTGPDGMVVRVLVEGDIVVVTAMSDERALALFDALP